MANSPGDGWALHEAERRRAWLALSPARRLELLEQAKAFCSQYLGAARTASLPAAEAPPRSADEEAAPDARPGPEDEGPASSGGG